MEKLIKKLEKELEDVDDIFDYYDSSDSTKKLIESEKRQIKRLIDVLQVIKTKTNGKRGLRKD